MHREKQLPCSRARGAHYGRLAPSGESWRTLSFRRRCGRNSKSRERETGNADDDAAEGQSGWPSVMSPSPANSPHRNNPSAHVPRILNVCLRRPCLSACGVLIRCRRRWEQDAKGFEDEGVRNGGGYPTLQTTKEHGERSKLPQWGEKRFYCFLGVSERLSLQRLLKINVVYSRPLV